MLTVLQIIPRLGAGGGEQSCVDMVKGLKARGDRALVMSAGGPRVKEIQGAGGEHFERPVHSKNPITLVNNARMIADFIRVEHVDIVHARSRAPAWSAWLACRATGCRFITTMNAAYKFSNVAKKTYNRSMTLGHPVITISHYLADHIHEAYGISRDNLRVIYRGIDLDRFDRIKVSEDRRDTLRRAWALPEGKRVVLFPARLSPIKGHELFIRAMAVLSQPALAVIVGDDQGRTHYRQQLEALVCALRCGDKIKIVSHCDDMPAAYSLADVAVAPSLVPEGFGRVPVEAMAMGVPVIASNLGAYNETVLEGKTGWLLSPEDPDAWAAALSCAVALSSDERLRMAETAVRHARSHFDQRDMVRETLKIYDEVI